MKPTIEIILVGNEILSGRTIDKNAPYMTRFLLDLGQDVSFVSVVGDNPKDMTDVFNKAAARADLIFVTGGLGPTSDDITIATAADAFGRKLVFNESVMKNIEEIFRRRNIFLSESNKQQAYIPEGAEVVPNPVGSAPGVRMKVQTGEKEAIFFFMPGVPSEMQAIFSGHIIPFIKKEYSAGIIETCSVNVSGIPESQLYDMIKHLPGAKDSFFFYPGYSGIEIKIRTNENSPKRAPELRSNLEELLGDSIFSYDADLLEDVVSKMLLVKKLKIAVAESCTGGLITHRLTNIPGSSGYLLCGVVSYSNESKSELLDVNPVLIEEKGAVSQEVAGSMAEGVRNVSGADIGISTTGIAGPGGATATKPLGLMYTGISSVWGTEVHKMQFINNRIINKERMSHSVINLLRLYINKHF